MSMWTLVAPLILAVTLQAAVAAGLFLGARWVAGRREARWWRGLSWLPLVALALSLIGVAVSMVFITRAFDAVASIDPSQKATLLAKNIASALYVTAFFVIPAKVFYAVSFVVSLVGSILKPTRRSDAYFVGKMPSR